MLRQANAHTAISLWTNRQITLLLVPMRLSDLSQHPRHAQAGRVAKALGWQAPLTKNRQATTYPLYVLASKSPSLLGSAIRCSFICICICIRILAGNHV